MYFSHTHPLLPIHPLPDLPSQCVFLWLEETVSRKTSWVSGSGVLSAPSSVMVSEPWV